MSTNRPRSRRRANRGPAAPAKSRAQGQAASRRRPAPAPPASASGVRGWLEGVSLAALTWLTRRPRWLVGLMPAAVLLGGLMAPVPWGPGLLGLVTLFVAWLLALAWPRLNLAARAARSGILALLVAVTVARSTGAL